MALATADGGFILSAQPGAPGGGFALEEELGDVVVSGCWVGACFVYTTERALKYCVGGEVLVVQHCPARRALLGYLERDSVVVLADKDVRFPLFSPFCR